VSGWGEVPIRALCKTGFARFLLKAAGAPTALLYHGVTDQPRTGLLDCEGKHVGAELFRYQMELLANNRKVVSLSTLVDTLRSGSDATDMVAITFDDGYLDNAECAAPILSHYGFPATFFLATGFIGTDRWLWNDRLEAALDRTRLQKITPSILGEEVPLRDLSERRAALVRMKRALKLLPWQVAEERVAELVKELELEPSPPMGLYRFMSWDDARKLAATGFELGAHTINHTILSRVSQQEAEQEILRSREQIIAAVGSCSRAFCYPNGKASDYTPEVRDFCSRHFDAALSAVPGSMRAAELFELRRLAVDNRTPATLLAKMLVRAEYE
jgi:peptidoglycan/xylan/chitin deacetylase (PgdA/CDA1 family)